MGCGMVDDGEGPGDGARVVRSVDAGVGAGVPTRREQTEGAGKAGTVGGRWTRLGVNRQSLKRVRADAPVAVRHRTIGIVLTAGTLSSPAPASTATAPVALSKRTTGSRRVGHAQPLWRARRKERWRVPTSTGRRTCWPLPRKLNFNIVKNWSIWLRRFHVKAILRFCCALCLSMNVGLVAESVGGDIQARRDLPFVRCALPGVVLVDGAGTRVGPGVWAEH